jgi:hypothetical protein
MGRTLSRKLFSADFSGTKAITGSFVFQTAREAGFTEDWLQRAIAENPDIVIGPCCESGLVPPNEEWRFWGREVPVRQGGDIKIDVLLLSSLGRIGIVETKLAYNPEMRRAVVAQVLEYAIHISMRDLPKIPTTPQTHPFANEDDVEERLTEPLLIIAGDQLDPRAIRLGNEVLGRHVTRGWDLALVEVAVFRREDAAGAKEYVLVPHLAGEIAVEYRQVVKIINVADKRIEVEEPSIEAGPVTVARRKWDEGQFLEEAGRVSGDLLEFAKDLCVLRDTYREVSLDFGTARNGSMILRKGAGSNLLILDLSAGGTLTFWPYYIRKALSEELANAYCRKLETLFHIRTNSESTNARFSPEKGHELLSLLKEILGSPSREPSQSGAAS